MASDSSDKPILPGGGKAPSSQELEWLNKMKASIKKDINLQANLTTTGKIKTRIEEETTDEGGEEEEEDEEISEEQHQEQSSNEQSDDSRQEKESPEKTQEQKTRPDDGSEDDEDSEDEDNDKEDEDSEKEKEDPEKEESDDENEDEDDEEEDEDSENENPEEEGLDEAEEGLGEAEEATEGAEAAETAAAGAEAAEGAAVAGETGAAAAGTGGIIAATAEIWVPVLVILLIIAAIIGLLMLIMVVATAKCNEDSLSGTATRWSSTVGSWVGVIPVDVCSELAINDVGTGGRSGGAGATGDFNTLQDDAAAREQLFNQAGVTVNSPQPKTSLAGISQATLNEVITFAQACGKAVNPGGSVTSNSCGVVFTGGTETNAGHAGGACSHISGNKFDMRVNTAVNNYIQNSGGFEKISNRSDGAIQYRSKTSNIIYALEGDHWDVGGVGC
jgi:hypothetical protein